MKLELYTQVILTRDLPAEGLRRGDVGTIVDRHTAADGSLGYSLEFFDMIGNTIAVPTVAAAYVRAPCRDDIPSVREVADRA